MWCDVMWCDVMWCDVMRGDVMWYDVVYCGAVFIHPYSHTPTHLFNQYICQILWLFGDNHEVTEVGSMNIFFVIKKKAEQGGGLELVTAPLTRGDILSGMMHGCCGVLWCCVVLCCVVLCCVVLWCYFSSLLSSPLTPSHFSFPSPLFFSILLTCPVLTSPHLTSPPLSSSLLFSPIFFCPFLPSILTNNVKQQIHVWKSRLTFIQK